jgi:RNA polymerase sigma factor (sigma-70 family)
MDDRALVAAMASGDPRGLDGAYRRYADRLYAYARSIVSDGETAADAVHDAFVLAGERIGQLRDPDRLVAWLYAIVRSECLRHLRARKRSAPLTDAHELPADLPDPAAGMQAEQVRALVRAAAAGLTPRDREVIELSVRHGLSASHVGAVLGVSANHAHARMSRARSQLEGALGALLVARGSGGRCVGLSELLHDWDGRLTSLLRKRINRHVKDCTGCERRRREWMSPAALLSAYGALPFTVDGLVRAPSRTRVEAPRFDAGTGFPKADRPRGRRTAVAVGIAVVVLLGAAPVVAWTLAPDPVSVGFAPPTAPPTVAISAGPGERGFGVAPTTGAGSAPAPPVTSPPPLKLPSTTKPPPPPKPFTVTATATASCLGPDWRLKVDMVATGGVLATANLHLQNPNITEGMAVTGNTATKTVTFFGSSTMTKTWRVTATSTTGKTFTTAWKTATRPSCP